MNRGTVMEIAGKTAVILTPDGQFIRVHAHQGAAVGGEISWEQSDRIIGKRAGASTGMRRWMYSAASAAVLLILCFALWSNGTPPVVAYVSMDINPSVEIGLDAKERVRELNALNEDAQAIVSGVSYRGVPVETVMTILADKLSASHILNADGGEIVIASVRLGSVDRKWETRVTEKIRQALQKATSNSPRLTAVAPADLTIETVYLPVEVRDEAKLNGISAGKMAFWLAAENSGHEVPIKDLKEKSVRKIASGWGGLKKVLDEGKIDKEDQEAWKNLLARKKEKIKKQEKETGTSPAPEGNNNGDHQQENNNDSPNNQDGVDHQGNQQQSSDRKQSDPLKQDEGGKKPSGVKKEQKNDKSQNDREGRKDGGNSKGDQGGQNDSNQDANGNKDNPNGNKDNPNGNKDNPNGNKDNPNGNNDNPNGNNDNRNGNKDDHHAGGDNKSLESNRDGGQNPEPQGGDARKKDQRDEQSRDSGKDKQKNRGSDQNGQSHDRGNDGGHE